MAFALDVSAFPPPAKGKEWQRINSFRATEDVLISWLKLSVHDRNP